jgi:hypothetical protein
MARQANKLSVKGIQKYLRKNGAKRYGDGGGLWLQVVGTASSWLFRYSWGGKQRAMGLGAVDVEHLGESLEQAREAAAECRRLLKANTDPIEARKTARVTARLDAAKSITFKLAAEGCIADKKSGWRNEKHAGQRESTLKSYAYPTFGELPVAAIDTTLVLKVLPPIWQTKTSRACAAASRQC